MAQRNDITGDELKTGVTTDAFRSGWDRIFGKKKEEFESEVKEEKEDKPE